MKKIRKLALKYAGELASLAVVCSFWFSTGTCKFILHQPNEPKGLSDFYKEKRNSHWK